jgi:hypothetical protein
MPAKFDFQKSMESMKQPAPILDEILIELRAIHALLEQQRARPRDDDDRRVLLVLADCGGLEARFSAREVVAHAKEVPELALALETADAETPRAVGRLFRRIEGRAIGNVRLDRCGEDRGGLVWRVSRVSLASPAASAWPGWSSHCQPRSQRHSIGRS